MDFDPGRINASGQIVGTRRSRSGSQTAVCIHGDSNVPLGTGAASGINDAGDIVGVIDSLPRLLHAGTRVSLVHPSADTSWAVIAPVRIDNEGRILAIARHGTTPPSACYPNYVLLTPITR